MKKKTYKRIQNRLYREIKRRMMLEHAISYPPKVCVEQRKIDTIRMCYKIPPYVDEQRDDVVNMVKRNLVYGISEKLQEEGYIDFSYEDGIIKAQLMAVNPHNIHM